MREWEAGCTLRPWACGAPPETHTPGGGRGLAGGAEGPPVRGGRGRRSRVLVRRERDLGGS